MPVSILFISNTSRISTPYLDPSTRYRCYHLAEALAKRSHHTAVISQDTFERNIDQFLDYDLFVFHRPLMTEIAAELFVSPIYSDRIIADFDDFIFDVDFTQQMPAHRFRGQSLSDTASYLASNAASCRCISQFTLSTQPLAQHIDRLFSPRRAEVITNTLDSGFQGVAQLIRQRIGNAKRPYRFGYFSGTATHDADLALVAPALAAAFDHDVSARMMILGPAKVPELLIDFSSRIDQRESVIPFHRLPAAMAQVETVIAPLEVNEFTKCKSGLKFFEAAAVGCNVVATPIPDIDRFTSPLLRKCMDPEDWTDALIEPFSTMEGDRQKEIARVCSLVDADLVASTWEKIFIHETR